MKRKILISIWLTGLWIQGYAEVGYSDSVYRYAKKIGIKYPAICTGQAIQESGHFKSRVFRIKNNCLGFKGSNGRYKRFKSWKGCLDYYKRWQSKNGHTRSYKQYFNFISRGYAEDKGYGRKVSRIIRQNRLV